MAVSAAIILCPFLKFTPLGEPINWIVFGSLAAIGTAALFSVRPLAGRIRQKRTEVLKINQDKARSLEEKAKEALLTSLQPISIKESLLQDTGELAVRCQRFAILLEQSQALIGQCRMLEAQTLRSSSQIQSLSKDLLTDPGSDVVENLEELYSALQDAKAWQEANNKRYEEIAFAPRSIKHA